MSRHRFAVAIAGAGLLATACGSAATTPTPSSTSPSSKLANVTFAFADANITNDYHITFGCGVVAAAKADGVTNLKLYGSTPHVATAQLPVLEGIAATNPNVLIIGLTDPTALNSVLQEMQSAGTKIVFYDQQSSDTSLGVGFVAANNYEGGQAAADALAKNINDTGTVLPIGDLTTGPVALRVQGFVAEMKAKYPNITVLPPQYDNESPTNDASYVNATIASTPGLTAIFPAYNAAAEGVVAALKADNFAAGKYNIVSFDADPTELGLISSGWIAGAINQTPYEQAKQAMQLAVDAATGVTITQREYQLPMPLITKSNMNDPSIQKEEYTANLCAI